MDISYGVRLRSFRRERGMRLKDVAVSVQIDLSYLSRIERGTRLIPSHKVRTAIYDVLKLNAAQICELEATVGKKATNTIFSAPLGAGKMILMVLNVKDAEQLLSEADTGIETFISRLQLKEYEM